MYAGRLDRKITLRSVSETVNAFGEPEEGFSDLVTIPAGVKEQTGKELFTSGGEQAQKRVIFTIRYRTDVTESMRIRYNSEDYDIESISEIQRRRGLQILAVRRTG